MRVTRQACGALVAAGVLALSACGGGSDAPAASSATPASGGSGTGAPAPSGTDAGGTDLGSREVGDEIDAVDLATAMVVVFTKGQTGHLVMDMGDGFQGEGDFEVVEGNTQNQSLVMDVGGQRTETLIVDGVTYLRGGAVASAGEMWVKSASADAHGIPNASWFDPATIKNGFSGVKAKVTKKDGDLVTYVMDLDLAKVLSASGEATPTGGEVPGKVPVSYTLGADNLPVLMTIEMGAMTINVAYSDWGKKVDITAPPSSQVTSM